MPLFKLADGRVFQANEEDLTFLSEGELIRIREKAKRKVEEVNVLLGSQDENEATSVPSQPETPVTPAENPPAQPEQPVIANPVPATVVTTVNSPLPPQVQTVPAPQIPGSAPVPQAAIRIS